MTTKPKMLEKVALVKAAFFTAIRGAATFNNIRVNSMCIEIGNNKCYKMNLFICLIISVLSLNSIVNSSVAFAANLPVSKPATDVSDAKRSKELLDRAVAYYIEKKDIALAAFMRQGEFTQGELYVYALNTSGIMLASGGSSAALCGRDVSDICDVDGKLLFREILSIAKSKGSGEVEYHWLNRIDRKIERKITSFRRVGDVIIAVGYYIPRASVGQAMDMLNLASNAVKKDSKSAFKAFADLRGRYIEDDLYVFVIGLDDMHFRAHGATPRLVGSDARTLTDLNGRPIIQEMVAIVKTKGQGELDYLWRNPNTNKIEKKHTFLRKIDNYLIGVGYYTR